MTKKQAIKLIDQKFPPAHRGTWEDYANFKRLYLSKWMDAKDFQEVREYLLERLKL